MGLRLRVILIIAVPALLVVGAHGCLRVREAEVELLEEDRRNLALTARAVQIAVENALRDRKILDLERLLADMVKGQEVIDRIRLFDNRVTPMLVSNPLVIGEAIPALDLRRVIETGMAEGFFQKGPPSFLYYLAPLRGRAGKIEGAMEFVQLATGFDQRLRAATLDLFFRLGLVFVVIVVLTWVVLQLQVVRPLAGLTEGIQRLGAGQPGPPLPVDRRDEIGRVAEAFNEMAVRLGIAREKLLVETERAVELEQELRRAATLAVAGKLASGLAHEVGTPLNVISSRAEFLLKSLPTGDSGRRELESIIGQIDRISKIINSLLDTVRPQAPEVRPVAVGAIVDQLSVLLPHAARQRGVALTTSIADGLSPVLADSGQLQQVLINLIVNGLEATPRGGRVTMTAAAQDHGGRPGVAVSVVDTGTGIPADVVPRVFEPFFTTKPRGEGTGLGLSICRDIVKAHGGDIRVASEEGKGSVFTVWLPAADERGS